MTKKTQFHTISGVHVRVSSGRPSAETLVRRCEMTNYRLIATSLPKIPKSVDVR